VAYGASSTTNPGLKTDAKGIATFEGEAKVAYFKDPDGHTLSIARAPRS